MLSAENNRRRDEMLREWRAAIREGERVRFRPTKPPSRRRCRR